MTPAKRSLLPPHPLRGAVLAASLLLAAPAFAQPAADRPAEAVGWYGGDYQDCANETSTPAIVHCLTVKAEAWDRRLNAAYGALLGGETPGQQQRLRAAERAWIAYRDANCVYYQNVPGTVANIKYAECLRVLTAQRAIELETALRP